MTETFTPWTLLVDVGIIAILLLIAKVLRVKIRLLQRLFIPTPLIAGLLALLFGPNGLGWLPLSLNTGTYASILIACVFGCLPFTSSSRKAFNRNVGRMWVYAQSGLILQWMLGGVLGLVLIHYLWPDLNSAFGLSMPAGLCGGHGTAAAIGHAFEEYHYDDMLSLAMTSATVGIIFAILGGLLFIKIGTKRGYTSFLTDFDDLPHEFRTGLMPQDKRAPMGHETTSPLSIDSLTLNLAAVLMVALAGYALSLLVKHFVPSLSLPVFSCAFVAGLLIVFLMKKLNVYQHFDTKLIGHISGSFTDLLVVCGVASIKVSAVVQYLVPLITVLAIGFAVTFIYVFWMARKIMPEHWFEKAIFEWGWYTGTTAMGITLLRVVDPEGRSHCLEDYGMAYMFIAPVEICLVTFAPMAFMSGHGWLYVGVCGVGLVLVLLLALIRGWLKK